MSLRYGLVPNHLTNDPNDYMGVVADNDTVSIEAIIQQIVNKGSFTTKAEVSSVIEEFEYAMIEAIKSGNSVATKLFKINPSISGAFVDQYDDFDLARHAVRLNINAGSRLSEAISDIKLKKIAISSFQPVIQQFVDLRTNLVNESFTPDQITSIRGSSLKFNIDDKAQGIFFIAADGTETRVENVIKNKPPELLFFTPETLTKGIFQVEVRIISNHTKAMKKGRLLNDLVPVG